MGRSDYVRDSGGRALGARLRRLSETIDRDAARCYDFFGVAFEQRWFGVLNQLRLNGPMAVGDIAAALNITHVSVSQTRKSLTGAGLVSTRADPDDARRNLLDLTAKGRALVVTLDPLWRALSDASAELDLEAGAVAEALDRLDDALARRSLFDRVVGRLDDPGCADG